MTKPIIKIKASDIEEEVIMCPYCMGPPSNVISCCGENATHYEIGFGVKGYSYWLLESEITIDETQ